MFDANACIFKISTTHYLPGYLFNIKTKMTLMMTWHLCARVCWKGSVWLRKPGHHGRWHVGDHHVYHHHHHHHHLRSPSNNNNFASTTSTLSLLQLTPRVLLVLSLSLYGLQGYYYTSLVGQNQWASWLCGFVNLLASQNMHMVIISNSILSFFTHTLPIPTPHQPMKI